MGSNSLWRQGKDGKQQQKKTTFIILQEILGTVFIWVSKLFLTYYCYRIPTEWVHQSKFQIISNLYSAFIKAPGPFTVYIYTQSFWNQRKLPVQINNIRVWNGMEKVTLEIVLLLKLKNYLCYYRTQCNIFPISRAVKLCVKKCF